MHGYRALSGEEVRVMEQAGCSAEDWSAVRVKEGFDPRRVRDVTFVGKVTVGDLTGSVVLPDGVRLPSEIAHATLVECEIGDNVRVTRVRGHLARYTVGPGAVVTDVGAMATRPGATFGNGVEVAAVNEGGGRETPIFNEMSSQFAYLFSMHRYRPEMIERLRAMVDADVAGVVSDRGRIGQGAVVAHVGEVEDVNVGAFATVSGASMLRNGTILSERDAPTRVGAGVIAEDFIIGEGSSVDGGALLSRVFVGQGVQIGKQFSAENALFFANSECFHGEACSILAGPYTVTHHKSTLLIAGIYSFFNAGSGTNQSNHMYKLGPVHQGVLERGSKMGSFSYMLWPSVIGPFSVVIGKHMATFNIGDLPFSYVTEEGGESFLTPAMNLFTVGVVRDGQKWPTRDRRKASVKRDLIRFEVFSPYTVGRMIRAEALLSQLYQETPREAEQVRYGGAIIKRLLLRHGARSYGAAIDAYLHGKVLERVSPVLSRGLDAVRAALTEEGGGVYSPEWADVAGLLIARGRLKALEDAIVAGGIARMADLHAAFRAVWERYGQDEWAWVRRTFEARTGRPMEALTLGDIEQIREAHQKASTTAIKKVLADAEKEFGEGAAFGYGADGEAGDIPADFAAVRGDFESNAFVRQMQADLKRATE
ncbi:MAG: hypothetical protein A3F84_21575 [Candidatus Handelsmanbacteria bacterium RIFCSPLOWO2_12_FULL_64_10]|uniref:DUF4954 domain-containing protein n=1 Tax=Handelsmanbacteria sp. (strain RIFCSPLOWO2_12_FULL_64_10) TaxID=1817868 RepID=A0A1F6C345_HANXR|nr:MAG: hypothetical protein A3F84_21575 [Candidatus Handelsmanbacteria bacterium RIFCSPLOWO2_12_FULL_64_10]